MVDKHSWKDEATCLEYDTNFFFDRYEEDPQFRPAIDALCASCPLARHCFAVGVSQKAWGVWGGIYLEDGKVSREFGNHRSKQQWAEVWKNLTIEKE